MYEDGETITSRYVLIEVDRDFEDNIRSSFIQTVDDPAVAAKLECAANRFGAEKHFLNAVISACLEREWFDFRGDRYEAEARQFCELYGIPYE